MVIIIKCFRDSFAVAVLYKSSSDWHGGCFYFYCVSTDFTVGSLWTFTALKPWGASLTNALFKRLLFTANFLTVVIITHPGCCEPRLTVRYSGTVACGDNYEANIINVMLEVAFKRCPKQCFLGPPVWKSKWRFSKKRNKGRKKVE